MASFVAGAGGSCLVEWIGTWGTIDLSGQYRTVTISTSGDTAESTSGTVVDRTYLPTHRTFTVSLDFLNNGITTPTTVANLANLQPRTQGTVRVSPLGTVTSNPKYTGAAIITTFDSEFPYDDVATMSLEWQGNGALTIGSY